MSEIHSEDRDFDRVASPALLAELEAAARYTKPITLDCSAAADVWGTITKLKSQLEEARAKAIEECIEAAASLMTYSVEARRKANSSQIIANQHTLCMDSRTDATVGALRALLNGSAK